MRRALADLGGERGGRQGGAVPRPASPIADGTGSAPASAQRWGQTPRPQASSAGAQSGGPRRNRFAAAADVPVVRLPLGPARERGRGPEPAAAGLEQAARAATDDRALREAQAKLDAVCNQLGTAELKLKDALDLIRAHEAEIASLRGTIADQRAELEALRPAPAPAVPVVKRGAVGRPRKTAAVREPKPVRWWIKST